MKNIIAVGMFLVLGLTTKSQSLNYFTWGLKGGLNYNYSSGISHISDKLDSIYTGKEGSAGWHLGTYIRFNIPIGIFIEPQFIFTGHKNIYNFKDSKLQLNINRIDIPAIVGISVLKIIDIGIGPVFSYNLQDVTTWKDLKQVKFNNYKLGVRLGVGVNLGNLSLNLYYDRKLDNSEIEFIQKISNIPTLKIDDRTSQLLLSIGVGF